MNHQDITIVDLEGLRPLPGESSQLPRIAQDIASALQATGFMYVRNHGIPPEIIEQLRTLQRAFFRLPVDSKRRVAINDLNRGYLGQGEARMHGAKQHDQKEVFFWGSDLAADHPDRVNKVPMCGANQWPDEPQGFEQAVLAYAGEISSLGDRLLEAIAIALGIEQHFFKQRYLSPMTRGQLIRYPRTVGGDDDFGVAPHTDFGCITLLLQETPGLEVLNLQDEWVAAPPLDDTLIINIGDLLERWTDGRLPSTRHRVRNLSRDERFSIAMFHDPDPTAVIDPADLQSNRKNFEPVMAADYIVSRNRGAFAHFGEVEKSPSASSP